MIGILECTREHAIVHLCIYACMRAFSNNYFVLPGLEGILLVVYVPLTGVVVSICNA